jgi:hypothetical protein
MRIFGRKRKTTLKHKRFWLYLGLGAMLFRALLQASQTVFARRRFSEKMTAMSFVAKWMEISRVGLHNAITHRISRNCSELFPLGIGIG